jgi:hypothetical protein
MADARCRHDLADGSGEIEALAHVPGPAGLLGLRLEIAPGHVEPGGIAIDMAERLARLDIGAAAPDGRHQLHLMMEIGGPWRIGHAGTPDQHGVGRLGEEEGHLAGRIAAHLADMLGIVPADAEDAPHGEAAAAGDGDGGDGRRGDDEIGHRAPRVIQIRRWAESSSLR